MKNAITGIAMGLALTALTGLAMGLAVSAALYLPAFLAN